MNQKLGAGLLAALLLTGCQGFIGLRERTETGYTSFATGSFLRLPALWMVRETSAVVTLASQEKVRLFYGPDADHLAEAQNEGQGIDYRFTLKGLNPSTSYVYQARTDKESLPLVSFMTAGAKRYSFAVFGDSRPKNGDDLPPAFSEVIKAVRGKNPRFAVGVGDNIQLTPNVPILMSEKLVRGRYDGFLRASNPLNQNTPLYMALGNHDRGTDALAMAGFNQAFVLPKNGGEGYYSWDESPVHFVVLNTELNSKADLGAAQLKWLENDLTQNSQPMKLVFLHRPFYGGEHGNDFEHSNPAQRDALVNLFKRTGVKAVFCGHDHYYRHLLVDGIHYVITGGAGAPTADEPEGGFAGPHYLMVNVGDTLSAKVFSVDGQVKDSW